MIKNVTKTCNQVVQIITEWPMCSYMIYMFIKSSCVHTSHSENVVYIPEYKWLVLSTVLTNIMFNGILVKYMPCNMYTILFRGFMYSILYSNYYVDGMSVYINRGVFGVIMGLARRRYTLMQLIMYNLGLVSVLYIACK